MSDMNEVADPTGRCQAATRSGFLVISVRKLMILNFFTFGLYWLCWTFNNWTAYKKSSGRKINPGVRSLLTPLFLYSLMQKVDAEIKRSGRSYAWSPVLLMAVAVAIVSGFVAYCFLVSGWLQHDYPRLDRWSAVWARAKVYFMIVIIPLPLLVAKICLCNEVQRAINFCKGDPKGACNSRLSGREKLRVAIGCVLWLLYAAAFCIAFLFWCITFFFCFTSR